MAARISSFLHFLLLQMLFLSGVFSATFTLSNNCDYTVWPGLLSGAGTAPLSMTGIALKKGESTKISAPSNWSGRMWGRTLCTEDSTGKFSCLTGDCGSGKIECSGAGALPPATLAEFTLDGANGLDFYDVSLVDGYNLPMLVVPEGGSGGNCTVTGCLVDLNGACPSELRVMSADGGENMACRSACEAFNKPEYCCSGEYGSPNTCKPSSYSQFFKQACPRAYSYAYDDGTSTFTCASANYVITFCPNLSSKKSSGGNGHPEAADLPLVNNSMVFVGAEYMSHAAPRLARESLLSLAVSVAVLSSILISSRQL